MNIIKNANDQIFEFMEDIPYREGAFYESGLSNVDRCTLDLTIPQDEPGFSTVVWFHGGGLTGGIRPWP